MAKKETILSVLKEIRSYLECRPRESRPLEVAMGSHFVKNENGTISDIITGLVWGPTLDGEMKHATAEKACKELRLSGHKDWRLPTVRELISLVDYEKYNPAIDTKFFPNTKSNWYWTSTICAGDPGYAWIVDFNSGSVDTSYKSNASYVRPVRSSK